MENNKRKLSGNTPLHYHNYGHRQSDEQSFFYDMCSVNINLIQNAKVSDMNTLVDSL